MLRRGLCGLRGPFLGRLNNLFENNQLSNDCSPLGVTCTSSLPDCVNASHSPAIVLLGSLTQVLISTLHTYVHSMTTADQRCE